MTAKANIGQILAIDPGPEESAYVLLSGNGKILGWQKIANSELQSDLCVMWRPDIIAIEMIASYGMAVGQEVFDTCRWVGQFESAAERSGRPVVLVYRKDIKMHLCHSMRAKDANIRQALIDKYGKPGTKKNPGQTYGIAGDGWAALAVADYVKGHAKEILEGL